ncbi:hypothetical protein [Nocardiopsis sp. ATB16-24]|uniref:hypothetical protein n=1 Tax=Nocardiopsis sp. ATB16-24 TaxID=3019555 RepID=UPI0025533D15|nr:hypothetical protein [Nocardiopsis sp. ATB16-24]
MDASAYARSEVTRSLCATVYLDDRFRRRVIREFVKHPERAVAPSLGFDVVPILRHGLRARRLETQASLWILGGVAALLLLAVLLPMLADLLDSENLSRITEAFGKGMRLGLLLLLVFGPLTWLSRFLTGRRRAFYLHDMGEREQRKSVLAMVGSLLRVVVWVGAIVLALALLATPFLPPFTEWWQLTSSIPFLPPFTEWWLLIFFTFGVVAVFTVLTWVVAWHRGWVEYALVAELGEQGFTGEGPKVATRYTPLLERIAREQHAGVTVYDPATPFLGAGKAHKAWSFTLELREAAGEQAAVKITGRRITDMVKRELKTLADSGTRLDRLNRMELSECVFLPGPLPFGYGRDALPTGHDDVSRQVGEAVEEGAEQRRHFLRVRIGGWEEQVVTTVFVRAHPRGRTLLLEVAPHVLTPLRERFRVAEAVAETNLLAASGPQRVFSAFTGAPTVAVVACASLFQALLSWLRTRVHGARASRVEAPLFSLREQVESHELSLFQEMDVARYVKTVQERMAKGVREALAAAGYETGEFQQRIVNINSGGVFIGGSMSGGAIATGEGARAGHDERSSAGEHDGDENEEVEHGRRQPW